MHNYADPAQSEQLWIIEQQRTLPVLDDSEHDLLPSHVVDQNQDAFSDSIGSISPMPDVSSSSEPLTLVRDAVVPTSNSSSIANRNIYLHPQRLNPTGVTVDDTAQQSYQVEHHHQAELSVYCEPSPPEQRRGRHGSGSSSRMSLVLQVHQESRHKSDFYEVSLQS